MKSLEAEAYDLQDGWLPDEKLVWTSDKVDAPLGTGEFLMIDSLPAGKHSITFTATNSEGLKASKNLDITVKK